MFVQAHRGVSTEYPENTMPAFEASYLQGYPIIEFDPLFTADGECVAFHDMTVNRTCRNADGSVIEEKIRVEDLTLEQLQALLDADKNLFEDFVRYAAEQGVRGPRREINRSRKIMEAQLRAYIGRNTALEDDGFYYNIFPIDEVVQRSIELLEQMPYPQPSDDEEIITE
jgi:glycerophosphoryl diester phosphodiesterase